MFIYASQFLNLSHSLTFYYILSFLSAMAPLLFFSEGHLVQLLLKHLLNWIDYGQETILGAGFLCHNDPLSWEKTSFPFSPTISYLWLPFIYDTQGTNKHIYPEEIPHTSNFETSTTISAISRGCRALCIPRFLGNIIKLKYLYRYIGNTYVVV